MADATFTTSDITRLPITFLPLESIIAEDRGRTELGYISNLAIDIQQHGLLHPILVRQVESKYKIISGERRFRSFEYLKKNYPYEIGKWDNIPARVVPMCDIELYMFHEIELCENISRLQLSPSEEIRLKSKITTLKYNRLGSKSSTNPDGWSQEQTAQLFSESPSTISRDLSIAPIIEALPVELTKKCKTKAELHSVVSKLRRQFMDEGLDQKLSSILSTTDTKDVAIQRLMDSYHVGDSLELIGKLNAETIDFIHCDPDYGTDIRGLKKLSAAQMSVDPYEQYEPKTFGERFKTIAAECYRVAKKDTWGIFWFGGEYQHLIYKTLAEVGFSVGIPLPGIWVKSKGQTNVPKRYLSRTYETFAYVQKGNPEIQLKGMPDVIHCESVPAQYKRHVAEKPVELLEHLLKLFTITGQMVLDVFTGSGNMLLASANRGNPCLGYDIVKTFKDSFCRAAASQQYGSYTSFKKKPTLLPDSAEELMVDSITQIRKP